MATVHVPRKLIGRRQFPSQSSLCILNWIPPCLFCLFFLPFQISFLKIISGFKWHRNWMIYSGNMKPFKNGLWSHYARNDFPMGGRWDPFLETRNFHTISFGCMLHVLNKMAQQSFSMTKHLRGRLGIKYIELDQCSIILDQILPKYNWNWGRKTFQGCICIHRILY